MPQATILELPITEQAALLREIRQARYGHLLAIHILLLLSAGKNPTEIADFLFCSRSSVYRAVNKHEELTHYQASKIDPPPKSTTHFRHHRLATRRRAARGAMAAVSLHIRTNRLPFLWTSRAFSQSFY